MINNLPSELIGIICTHLDFKSIHNLKYTCSNVYNIINDSSNYIVKNELSKINSFLKPFHIHNFLNTFCKVILYKNINILYSRNHTYDSITHNSLLYELQNKINNTDYISVFRNTTNFLNNTNQNSNYFLISYNSHVNLLFKKVLEHFIYYGSVEKYDNISLLFLYNFIQIEQFNISDLNYYINFIEDLTLNKFNTNYDDIIKNYYKYIIKNLNYEDSFTYSQETNYIKSINLLSLDQLYKISKWIITPHMIQKLLTYKALNIYNSELMICCNLCFKTPISYIVNRKFTLRDDDLVSHNYTLFKSLIISNCDKYISNSLLNYLENIEKKLVNKYIYITDPKTNKRKRLCYSSNFNYNSYNSIKKNQKFLINKIFNS
jgi:hypothetical protein